MTETEQWRPIEGYEELYEVSNLGRIKSLERIDRHNHLVKEKILSPRIAKNGYLQVNLYKEGKKKTFRVHRLVGMVFIPNPEGLSQINHRDEDKTNNVVFLNPDGSFKESNLEWCDLRYNCNYGTRNERMVQTKISKGMYDPEMCGMRKDGDRKEYDRLYKRKRRRRKEKTKQTT